MRILRNEACSAFEPRWPELIFRSGFLVSSVVQVWLHHYLGDLLIELIEVQIPEQASAGGKHMIPVLPPRYRSKNQ